MTLDLQHRDHAQTGQWGSPRHRGVATRAAYSPTILFKKWRKSERDRKQWDAIRLKFPFKIGQTVQKISLARWSLDAFATRAILLWMLVAGGLAYGVINTISQVADLFSG